MFTLDEKYGCTWLAELASNHTLSLEINHPDCKSLLARQYFDAFVKLHSHQRLWAPQLLKPSKLRSGISNFLMLFSRFDEVLDPFSRSPSKTDLNLLRWDHHARTLWAGTSSRIYCTQFSSLATSTWEIFKSSRTFFKQVWSWGSLNCSCITCSAGTQAHHLRSSLRPHSLGFPTDHRTSSIKT